MLYLSFLALLIRVNQVLVTEVIKMNRGRKAASSNLKGLVYEVKQSNQCGIADQVTVLASYHNAETAVWLFKQSRCFSLGEHPNNTKPPSHSWTKA